MENFAYFCKTKGTKNDDEHECEAAARGHFGL